MDNLRTDEEQVAALKQLWKDYGSAIVFGVAVSLAGVYGWRAWDNHKMQQAENSSALYQELVDVSLSPAPEGFTEEQQASIENLLESLKKDYDSATYTQLATLLNASVAVQSDNLKGARESLTWILGQKPSQEIATIARLRLARIEMADNKAEAALTVLSQIDQPGAFKASYENVRGDVLLALGRKDEAREAYQAAVNLLAESAQSNPLITLKLDDLTEPREK